MELSNPLVSVAIATYNGAHHIEEQMDSILAQTYKHIEIIIVDDCSTDNTVEIIKEYREKYPFIRLFINKQNEGVTASFEKAVRLCNGYYIALSDQDDIWEKEKVEILEREIGKHDAVYSNSLLVDENGNSLTKTFSSLMNLQSFYTGVPFLLSNTVPGHSMLLKKDFVKKILPFPKHLFFDLWIAFNAAANNGIKYVDKTLVHYRQHTSNLVGTRMSANKRIKLTKQEEFDRKKIELETLATAPIKDEHTEEMLAEMITLFKRKWSIKRSAFFFSHFKEIMAGKKKPLYRKILYCIKMFFKPNF